MANWYLAYAKSGKEFEAADEISELIECWCGKVMEFKSPGKKRKIKAVTKPKLPNYLFLNMPAETFWKVQTCSKYLYPTFSLLTTSDLRGSKGHIGFLEFRDRVDEEYRQAERIRMQTDPDKLEQYVKGQKLTEITGRFSDRLLVYHGMIQQAHDLYPKVQAYTEMFGRETLVSLDPLDVKAVQ